MSNRRGSISDYPEHLNPFYEGDEKFRFWKFGKVKRSGSFGKTLRNTLTLKSFRGKKKNKQEVLPPSSSPELRRHDSIYATQHRQTFAAIPTLSPIASPARNTIALPRSRFSERVRKTTPEAKRETSNVHVSLSTPEISCSNPFEEDEKVGELKPKRIRRRKRRAPLPPNMSKEEGDAYLGVSSLHNLSKWSLTSVETDISTYSENDDRLVLDNSINEEMSELMNNITKEMEKLTEDTNDHSPANTTKELKTKEPKTAIGEKQHPDIPDIIASSTDVMKEEDRNNDTSLENLDLKADENSNLISNDVSEANKAKDTISDGCDNNEDCLNVKYKEKCVEENSNNVYNTTLTNVESAEDLNFNKKKSIYINSSNDNLNNTDMSMIETTEKVDIDLNEDNSSQKSPRCKTEINIFLNNNNIQENTKEKSEEEADVPENKNEENVCKPIPKFRKHAPTKNDLLGNDTQED